MGQEICGWIIVGAHGTDLLKKKPEEFGSLCEWIGEESEHWMECVSQYYDANEPYRYWGYLINDVDICSVGWEEWIDNVEKYAQQFKEITGVQARLIGSQSVY